MEPAFYESEPDEPMPADPETLDMFAPAPIVDVPVHLPAPSAPGSSTSAAAADAMTADDLQREQRRVLFWYAAQSDGQTRQACGRALYPDSDNATSSACGRINGLIVGGLLEECGVIGRRALIRITARGRGVANQLMARQSEAA